MKGNIMQETIFYPEKRLTRLRAAVVGGVLAILVCAGAAFAGIVAADPICQVCGKIFSNDESGYSQLEAHFETHHFSQWQEIVNGTGTTKQGE